MDEDKLKELFDAAAVENEERLDVLFRNIMENKIMNGPPSCFSSSKQTTLDSSLGDETYVNYQDVMDKLQEIVQNMYEMKIDIEGLLMQSKLGIFDN